MPTIAANKPNEDNATMEQIAQALSHRDLSFLKRAFPLPRKHDSATGWTEILTMLHDTHGRDIEGLRSAVGSPSQNEDES